MNTMARRDILFLTLIIYFILAYRIVLAQHSEMNKDTQNLIINDAITKINKIRTYQVILNTHIYEPGTSDHEANGKREYNENGFRTINSNIHGISGKKMRIKTSFSPPEINAKIDFLLIYDGVWLWVEQQSKKHGKEKAKNPKISVIKIRISEVSPDPKEEPFHTIYGISGIGLFRYKDLPGTLKKILTSYKFMFNVHDSKKGEELIFSGKLDQLKEGINRIEPTMKNKVDKTKGLSTFLKRRTSFCKIWISSTNKLIEAFSLGASEKRIYMLTEINYLSLNEILPKNTFNYTPPSGVEVRDITSDILKVINSKDPL